MTTQAPPIGGGRVMPYAFPYLLAPTFLATANRARRRERGDLSRVAVFGAIGFGVAGAIFAIVFWLTWQLNDYEGMCRHHQTSPESIFTRKTICSRATRTGRVTLANDRLIVTSEGKRQERPVASAAEYLALLRDRFGVALEDGVDAGVLMHPSSMRGR